MTRRAILLGSYFALASATSRITMNFGFNSRAAERNCFHIEFPVSVSGPARCRNCALENVYHGGCGRESLCSISRIHTERFGGNWKSEFTSTPSRVLPYPFRMKLDVFRWATTRIVLRATSLDCQCGKKWQTICYTFFTPRFSLITFAESENTSGFIQFWWLGFWLIISQK